MAQKYENLFPKTTLKAYLSECQPRLQILTDKAKVLHMLPQKLKYPWDTVGTSCYKAINSQPGHLKKSIMTNAPTKTMPVSVKCNAYTFLWEVLIQPSAKFKNHAQVLFLFVYYHSKITPSCKFVNHSSGLWFIFHKDK